MIEDELDEQKDGGHSEEESEKDDKSPVDLGPNAPHG